MKKFFKILGILFAILLFILYLVFIFVVPRVVNITPYKSEIQKLVKEQANLDINYTNEKVVTTPFLGIGFKANDITVTLPDNTKILTADKIKATVSLPHILFLTVRVSSVDIINPVINAEILKNGEDYKIVKHIENLLNKKKEMTFGQKPVIKSNEGFHFDPAWIKIVVPNVKLHNYKVLITDLGSKHYLDLHGEKLIFGYFNGNSIRVRTIAELFSDTNKNIAANIDFDTFLPKSSEKLDEEDDPAEKIDIPFINPVTTYQTYDLKANIDSKIKIRYFGKEGITSYGHFNVENLTLKLSQIQLPESYFKIRTFGKFANIDSDIFASKEEHIHLLGKVNYSRHPNIDMNIKTSEIKFQDLLNLVEAYLKTAQINNELNQFKANGSLLADCHIKTNFKKLKSNGYIKVKNGALKVRNLGEVISKVNINALLDNNILKIENSGLFIENSEVKIKGAIDEKSYTDVNISTKGIPLAKIYKAFAPKNLRESFNLKSGNLGVDFKIQGKMKAAISELKLNLLNFEFNDIKNSFAILNKELGINMNFDGKTKNLTGKINNNNFTFKLPKTNSLLSLPKLNINIADKNINIAPDVMYFNNSKLQYSGNITDYEELMNIEFLLKGDINTKDIITLLGNELNHYINSKGVIPVKLSVKGDKSKQTVLIKALGDSNNYITPIDFKNLQGLNTSIQAILDFKPNRIKVKKTGVYIRNTYTDENGQENEILKKVIELDGTIERNRINLMKFNIPQDLQGKIYLFPKSNFTLEKTKIYSFGNVSAPIIRGELNIKQLSIPEIRTTLDNLNIKILSRDLHFAIRNLMMKRSDISAEGRTSLEPASNIILNGLKITSKYINLDDITSTTEALNKYISSPANTKSAKGNSQQDIPVIIPDGSINFRRIVTGNIELTNTISRLLLRRNKLYLNNLSTNVFKGNVRGNINVDLIKLLVGVKVSGTNIDIAKALLDAAATKDALSGTTDFTADLTINGGAATADAQIKGINGVITFRAKDGQFGPFGKLENMILAENIRESQFFQTALGGVINKLSTIDTTHFTELDGQVTLKDGICVINHISSKGNAMNLHILGNFDILKNYTDMKVRVKLTSIISNLLGPINAINPVNLMNNAASMNVVTAKAFSLFCETVPEEEFALLPTFDNKYVDTSSTKFQLGVRGDVAKPLTLIKSFKWLATKAQVESAESFVESIPEPIEGSTATTIQEVIEEAKAAEAAKQAAIEAEKKTFRYKFKHLFKKEETN